MNPNQAQTVDWEELDKTRFYTYGVTFFMGVRALLYPPFLLKTKIQVERGASGKSSYQVAKSTFRQEGIRGLYKGFWISSTSLIFRQVYFTTYEVVRHKLGPHSRAYQYFGPDKGEVVRNMAAGAASSTVMQVFTVPIDIIGQRMMVDGQARGEASTSGKSKASAPTSGARAGHGVIVSAAGRGATPTERANAAANGARAGASTEADGARSRGRGNVTAREVARQVYKESGIRGFYRGLGISVLQFAPTSAIWWAAYGVYSGAFMQALERLPPWLPSLSPEQRQISSQGAAGFCTGMTTVMLTNPLDVLRTRLQVDGRRGDDKTIMSEYRVLMKESGPMGLMKGLGPRMLAMAPASVLIVSVYELIKRLSRKTQPDASAPSLLGDAAPHKS